MQIEVQPLPLFRPIAARSTWSTERGYCRRDRSSAFHITGCSLAQLTMGCLRWQLDVLAYSYNIIIIIIRRL